MQQLALAIGFFAVISLGLSAGALLAEAGVLVPFWRSEDPKSFLAWYERHASLLLKFFGPLEAVSGVLVLVSTALAWLGLLPGRALFGASTGLTIAVLASFPLYFKEANARFAAGSLDLAKVAPELERWATWHWARTILATVAFGLAVLAMTQRVSAPAI